MSDHCATEEQLLNARREAATWLGEVRRLQVENDQLREQLTALRQERDRLAARKER